MCNKNDTSSFDNSGWFIASKVSQLILAPLALILNLSLIAALINLKSIHLHNNLRYLLANVSACSALASLYAFVKSAVTMTIWLAGNKCK
uniref:NADH dehydrogenase subunit 2 n=2 Tax=Romanomermis culicivorax TaxID=13658 RepID=A0A915K8G2_ROMCU